MKDQNEEIAACPICGAQPRVIDFLGWEIDCPCGLNFSPPYITDRSELIAAWNRGNYGALRERKWPQFDPKTDPFRSAK